jgi:hypothetical protein
MPNEKFDPITVEAQLVQARILPVRADIPPPFLGTLEQQFTEHDPRKWALWRISMVRQFQPAVSDRCPPKTCCTSRVSPRGVHRARGLRNPSGS